HRLLRLGVVSRRAKAAESHGSLSTEQSVHGAHSAAGRVQRSIEGGAGRDRVGVEQATAVFAKAADAFDIAVGMDSLQASELDARRRFPLEPEPVRFAERRLDGADSRRLLGVATGLV